MTLIQMINLLLPRLREAKVSTITASEYATLLAQFVNEGMQEVQGRYLWTSLDHTVTTNTVAGTFEYSLTGTKPTSLLRMVDDIPMTYIFDSGSTEGSRLKLVSNMKMEDMYRTGVAENSEPQYFSLFKNTSNNGWTMRLYPVPDAVYTVTSRFWTPQEDLALDGTDDDTGILCPNEPVRAYALMMAANERGEEMGEPGNLLERRFYSALSEAIETEIGYDGVGNVHEFRRD